MRVGEMVLLNRNDIDFNEREGIVLVRVAKNEQFILMQEQKTHLQKYGSDAINKPLMAAEPSVSYKKKKYLRLNSLTIKMDF